MQPSRLTAIGLRLIVSAVLLLPLTATAQVREYDWYPEFRRWVQSSSSLEEARELFGGLPPRQSTIEAIAKRYGEKLLAEGVDRGEIDRRLTLFRTKRAELEADVWNRLLTTEKPAFNTEPNAFLASVVEGRKPGKALDVGMGEGRNALFLAKLGWDVTGFDPADQAVALASTRATALNLKIRAVVDQDVTFNFGRDQWDLILYSWVPPMSTVSKAIESLRPGGIVVVEAGRDWFPLNGLLKMFDTLRVVHYDVRTAKSDFFNRSEMPVVRFVAEKPEK